MQDVTAWTLFGAKQTDAEETPLTTFSIAEGTTVILEPATWRFTLAGYKEDDIIPTGTISEQTISATETKDDILYGAVSEAVHVWANLLSEATYTLSLADLNLTYVVTYRLWDEETAFGYYQVHGRGSDATRAGAPRLRFQRLVRDGGLERRRSLCYSYGQRGDKDFYAKWRPANLSLVESLAWISEKAAEGGVYTVTLNADESLAPTSLSYDGKNVRIILDGETRKGRSA